MSGPAIYKTEAGLWRCESCSLWQGKVAYSSPWCGDMLEHLMSHQRHGEELPEREVNLLLREFWESKR